jgi:hypothetical protein
MTKVDWTAGSPVNRDSAVGHYDFKKAVDGRRRLLISFMI